MRTADQALNVTDMEKVFKMLSCMFLALKLGYESGLAANQAGF